MTPAASVLLTCHNRERYLAASIESVLAQTFSDFELLIVDDGSTDGSVDIARSYERRDPRVRVLVNERNLGQFGNRNRAAELARGRLLKYHDSDDAMYPHCLAVMVGMLDACPDAAFGLSNSGAWPGGPCPMVLTPRMAYQREFFGGGLFMCGPAGAIFRADAFRALGGFDDAGVPSDYVFWLRACARTAVALLPADLFWYRLHADQALESAPAAREYAAVGRYTWAALRAATCPLVGDEREAALSVALFRIAKASYRDCRAGRFGLAAYRVRASGIAAADWVRFLRLPRRSRFAGTPTDAQGEFIMPDWHRLGGRDAPTVTTTR
jgi:glycosyltransferase involved in cell wall biosynthesis